MNSLLALIIQIINLYTYVLLIYMNFSIGIPLNDFNINNVILKDKTINKLIPNSTFCKLMYSKEICHDY